mmetsp:Transcript_37731/g.107793  ORF Transcript_37731/g.107793 Transcript_37731/m.107793 type:complete len:367 (-) Transcript_37731:858-1958(-)
MRTAEAALAGGQAVCGVTVPWHRASRATWTKPPRHPRQAAGPSGIPPRQASLRPPSAARVLNAHQARVSRAPTCVSAKAATNFRVCWRRRRRVPAAVLRLSMVSSRSSAAAVWTEPRRAIQVCLTKRPLRYQSCRGLFRRTLMLARSHCHGLERRHRRPHRCLSCMDRTLGGNLMASAPGMQRCLGAPARMGRCLLLVGASPPRHPDGSFQTQGCPIFTSTSRSALSSSRGHLNELWIRVEESRLQRSPRRRPLRDLRQTLLSRKAMHPGTRWSAAPGCYSCGEIISANESVSGTRPAGCRPPSGRCRAGDGQRARHVKAHWSSWRQCNTSLQARGLSCRRGTKMVKKFGVLLWGSRSSLMYIQSS